MSDDWDWHRLSPEEKKTFIAASVERGHKRQYEAALELMDYPGPPWEELSEEAREKIREENRRYAREMHEFGKSLSQK